MQCFTLMAFHKGLPYHTDVRMQQRYGKNVPLLMFCTAYPSQEGPVPTLLWEDYREGITDMRWIRLYEKLDRESNGALGRETLNRVLQPFYYRGESNKSLPEFNRKNAGVPSMPAFEEARGELIRAVAAQLDKNRRP